MGRWTHECATPESTSPSETAVTRIQSKSETKAAEKLARALSHVKRGKKKRKVEKEDTMSLAASRTKN